MIFLYQKNHAGLLKAFKLFHDNHSDSELWLIGDGEKKTEIAKEIGDVLWYCATLSHDIGFSLENIAQMNYEKLHSRQLRGKLHGSGDNR